MMHNPDNALFLMGHFSLQSHAENTCSLINYEKARLVLAVLAMAKHQKLDRTTLADMIWQETPAGVRRARLRHALHTLRQALNRKHEILLAHKDTLQLNTQHLYIDAKSILDSIELSPASIEHKLRAYQGQFLDPFTFPPGSFLDEWQQYVQRSIETAMAQTRRDFIEQVLPTLSPLSARSYRDHCARHWPEDTDTLQAIDYHCATQPDADGLVSIHLTTPLARHKTGHSLTSDTAASSNWGILAIKIDLDRAAPKSPANHDLRQYAYYLKKWLQGRAAYIDQVSESHLIAYFGPTENIRHTVLNALHTTEQLLAHSQSLPPIKMGLGLHLHSHTKQLESDYSAFMTALEIAMSLSWQAADRQALLSGEFASTIEPQRYRSSRLAHTHYVLIDPSEADGNRL